MSGTPYTGPDASGIALYKSAMDNISDLIAFEEKEEHSHPEKTVNPLEQAATDNRKEVLRRMHTNLQLFLEAQWPLGR